MAVNFTESEIKRGVTEWAALPEELDVVPEMNGPTVAVSVPGRCSSPASIKSTGGEYVYHFGLYRCH